MFPVRARVTEFVLHSQPIIVQWTHLTFLHVCKTCKNLWKKAASFTAGLSLEFCEILLYCCLATLYLSNTNQKKLFAKLWEMAYSCKLEMHFLLKIFLSWDLGTVFCFLESCQAYIACKTNIQNHARSTAAKMLKCTWSLILSHPAQKSTSLTSSTSIQNGQLGLWKKTVRWKIIVSVSMTDTEIYRQSAFKKTEV